MLSQSFPRLSNASPDNETREFQYQLSGEKQSREMTTGSHLPLTVPQGESTTGSSATQYVNMDSSQNAIMQELTELFFELVDHVRGKSWKKKVLTALMVISSILVFTDLLFLGNIVTWIGHYADWMKLHVVAGTFLFIAIFVVATLVMVPPALLTFVCGYVYSEVTGLRMAVPSATLVSFVGCAIGAAIAFVRARYMMRDLITLFSKRYKIVRAADRAIRHHGFRVFVLLRLCPIIPFNGLNYIGGITDVTMEEYIFSLIGILPSTVLTVLAGATTSNMVASSQNGTYTRDQYYVYLALIALGSIFVVTAVVLIVYKARKELQKDLLAESMREEALKAFKGTSLDRPPSPTGASAGSSVEHEQPSTTGASTLSSRHDEPAHLDEVRVQLFEDDEEWFWLFP